MGRQPRARRRTILVCALLGIGTTIGVSWGIAVGHVYSGQNAMKFGQRQRAGAEGAGELLARSFHGPGWAIIETVTRDETYFSPQALPPGPVVPSWARAAVLPFGSTRTPWPAPGTQVRLAARGTGFPVIAMFHEYRWIPGGSTPLRGRYAAPGGILLDVSTGTPGAWPHDYPRALPLRPAWPGFALNSAAAGALWYAFARIAARTRRCFRPRRGTCECCGYNLSGLPELRPCPECGHSRPSSTCSSGPH